ncbi:MAG: hypothetical protein KGJ86_13625, partial [Chloroflexota bacterium]|nr:hypothetical protein [Chloroflexota bacterium]
QGQRWTVVGTPAGGPETLQGPDGRWEPTAESPAISALLLDRRTGRLIRPAAVRWSLAEGHLPIARTDWASRGLEMSTELWRPGQPDAAVWTVSVRNAGASAGLSLLVAIQPYQVQPGVAPLHELSFQQGTVVANKRPLLRPQQSPSGVAAATGQMGDVTELLAEGRAPATASAVDGAGLASLALRYDFSLAPGASRRFSFTAPVGSAPAASGPLDVSLSRSETASTWRSLLRVGDIELPDRRLADAYYASIAYILMSNDGGALHPGPLLHDGFWYRDASYMLSALERNGNLAEARRLAEALLRFQDPDGSFPAFVSTHRQIGHPRGAPEWDSQGQGIHALAEYYRFSQDLGWLRAAWPAIEKAARWMNRLRSTQPDGLLPPGASAEDLGPADQTHYWDDFWGIIGQRDAALAAAAVGDGAAEQEFSQAASSLLSATMAAVRPVLREDGVIPNSPKDARSPATARGSTPAIWPGQLLAPDVARPVVQRYFERYVRPYKGAFLHANDNFWPFGGLELAHAALYLGLADDLNMVLDWQLSHQTADGVYAWGDEVSQDGRSLLIGDMPHGWTAAEYASLVRDMLLYESGDRLVLGAGVRPQWLAPGETVAVNDLPTYFGRASYRLTRSGHALLLDVTMASPPRGGFDLHLPAPSRQLSIDGSPFVPSSGSVIRLPPFTRHAEIRLSA